MQELQQTIQDICRDLYSAEVLVVLTRTEEQFGDYATNVALQIAQRVGKNPRDVASAVVDELHKRSLDAVAGISVAGPGFINITLSNNTLIEMSGRVLETPLKGKTVLVEYLDPNPFKELHIGHAYSGTIGDSIAHLFSVAGAKVHRVTYQGDVGLHVAKALYGMQQQLGDYGVDSINEQDRAEFLGNAYATGSAAYDADENAKAAIIGINKSVYSRDDPSINTLYDLGKAWSLEYFKQAYERLGFTPFERNYMEGEVAEEGLELVKAHVSDGTFVESDDAIIFKGEDFGLHTRVFVNAQGLPTYEAKDLGNAMQKWRDYSYNRSIIITAEEQTQYFKVMLKALEQFAPEQAHATTHIAHGMVRLSTGKMSSRTGQVLRALDVLDTIEQATATISGDNVHESALAALKYAFLKNRIGSDIAFNIEESVSLEGNSGPYLQYAHARARSILAKTTVEFSQLDSIEEGERSLVRKLGQYSETVAQATQDMTPHLICSYLYELAQVFNRFYEKNRVIDDPRESQRLALISRYADVLKEGLELLGIQAPDRM